MDEGLGGGGEGIRSSGKHQKYYGNDEADSKQAMDALKIPSGVRSKYTSRLYMSL